jgi:hypothetical protein
MNIVKTVAIVIFITGLFVFFQNCSVQQNTGILGSKDSTATIVDKVNATAPFAFDLAPDTISYNSCVGEQLNNQAIHGLKIGVNEGFVDSTGSGAVRGGLKLRSDFLQFVGANLSPRYPSDIITPAQIQSLLTSSKANADTHIQFAVRKKGDLTVVPDLINPTSNAISLLRDGKLIPFPLNLDPVATKLAKNVQFGKDGLVLSEGPRIYNLGEDSSATPIEASFGYSSISDETFGFQGIVGDAENFGMGERYSEVVRNRFNLGTDDKYILTTSYGSNTGGSDGGLNSPRRLDPKVTGRAYGRSYALTFNIFASPSAAGWKNNSLKNVVEYDMATNSIVSAAPWECRSYVIMQQKQWNNTKMDKPSCSPLLASDLANATIATAVKNLRRHYLETDWSIGLFYDANQPYIPGARSLQPICLVPKVTECYLPTNNNIIAGSDVGVNYNPTTECYLYNRVGTTYTSTLDVVKANGRCAQFASICVRKSTN